MISSSRIRVIGFTLIVLLSVIAMTAKESLFQDGRLLRGTLCPPSNPECIPFCNNDGTCDINETCLSCAADCGSCTVPSSIVGSTGSAASPPPLPVPCCDIAGISGCTMALQTNCPTAFSAPGGTAFPGIADCTAAQSSIGFCNPAPTGACCNNNCTDGVTSAACGGAPATFHVSTTCTAAASSDPNCVPSGGACCNSGTCTITDPATCATAPTNHYLGMTCPISTDPFCVPETNCSDGDDNDGDGNADCADVTGCLGSTLQCAASSAGMDSVCVNVSGGICHTFETNCNNLNDDTTPKDDDGDGLANCADIDCNGIAPCGAVSCGDSIVQTSPAPAEQCDNGLANNADIPNRACRTSCQWAKCGDGITDTAPPPSPSSRPSEQCDDGSSNSNNPDACRPDCKLPICGDAIVDTGEECDLGSGSSNNNNPNSLCRINCKWAKCQDGVIDNAPPAGPFALPAGHPPPPSHGNEQCDDGNSINSDGCNASCHLPDCGNGVMDGIENCDIGKRCADGFVCTTNADCVAPHTGGCISRFGCSSNCGAIQCTVATGYPGYAPPIPAPPAPIPVAFTPVESCAAQQALLNDMRTKCKDNTCGGAVCTAVPSGRTIDCDNSAPLNGDTDDAEDGTTTEEYYYCLTSYPKPHCTIHPPADLQWLCQHPSYAPLCDPPFGGPPVPAALVLVMPTFTLPDITLAFVSPPPTPSVITAETSAMAAFVEMFRRFFGF
ncbi:hypothetical protein EXS65_01655 [Candidatus Peribacteria bacterium]|nr:hypothetical protein [Candidatus Peribacteria bacterium]